MTDREANLRHALRSYSVDMARAHAAPPSGVIWLRAERRKRRLAFDRALRPLRFMRIVSLLVALLAVGWVLHLNSVSGASARPGTTISEPFVAVSIGAILLAVSGCWTMIRASRRLFSD